MDIHSAPDCFKMNFSIKNTCFISSILIGLIVLVGLTYINRFPTGDDAWFAEQSYWFQKQGIIRSEFFRGILGWEKQILVSHKLFLIFGAGLIKIFGFGLPTVQLVGFVFFLVLLGELTSYIYQDTKENRTKYIILLLTLVFSNRLLIRLSFENRPELMVAALGFGSFLYVKSSQINLRKAAYAGLLAGMALLCHLNGVIYLIAGAISYLYGRRYKEFVLFSIIGGLTSLLYFVDVIQAQNGFSIWYYQFRHDPAVQQAFGWQSKLIVMLTYPKLFIESPEQAALTLLFIFMLWQQRKFIRQLPLILTIYSATLFVSFWIITKHGSGSYMPLFMPFMFILIYELYKRQPFINWGLRIVMLAYFIIGIYGTIEIIYKDYVLGSFPTAYKNLRSHIPKSSTGFVPLTFFFDEYEQYDRLLCHENFRDYSDSVNKLPDWAIDHQVNFMVMDYVYRPESFYPEPGTKKLGAYQLSYFDGRFAVYIK